MVYNNVRAWYQYSMARKCVTVISTNIVINITRVFVRWKKYNWNQCTRTVAQRSRAHTQFRGEDLRPWRPHDVFIHIHTRIVSRSDTNYTSTDPGQLGWPRDDASARRHLLVYFINHAACLYIPVPHTKIKRADDLSDTPHRARSADGTRTYHVRKRFINNMFEWKLL